MESASSTASTDVVASLFLARSPDGAPIELPDTTLAAVRVAMGERCPGPIVEHRGPGFLCLVGGRDATVVEDGDRILVADGIPRLSGSGAGEGPEALAVAWERDPDLALSSLVGSFALAAVDGTTTRLQLVRDRFGTRPLYWVEHDGRIFVASECKMLAALGIPLGLGRAGLDESLLSRWIVGDRHLLAPIRQVAAATTIAWSGRDTDGPWRYWTLTFTPEGGGAGGLERYRDATRRALVESIRQLAGGRSSVGVLLSGGVDSSVLAGAALEAVGECIGFIGDIPGTANQELERAEFVARHLGIELRVVPIRRPSFTGDLRAMVRRLEEPPRHPNNTVLDQLYERIADEVAICLHGDGAEMLFGLSDVGRVARFRRKHRIVAAIPRLLRSFGARALRRLDHQLAQRLARVLIWDPTTYAARLDTIAYSAGVERSLRRAIGAGSPGVLPTDWFETHTDFSDALQAYQAYTFLTSSLVRHDRLAQPYGLMAVSPFLEGPTVEVSRRLPRELRFTDGPKPVLRALCDVYLPGEVSRWPKLGFPVPWTEWLRDSLSGEVALSPVAAGALPADFLSSAIAKDDAEALWTAVSLDALVEAFELTPDGLWTVTEDPQSTR